MRVLLADDDEDRARALVEALGREAAAREAPIAVQHVGPGELLFDAVARHRPNVVLVDMARPDRDALDNVRSLSRTRPHPVVLFVDEDDPAFMQEAIAAGVCSYNVGSVAAADIKPVLWAAVALFRHMQAGRTAFDAAETRARERAVLDRAKLLLIRERRLTEPEAHRWLQRRAMASGRRLPEVALALLAEAGRNGSR